MTGMRASAVVLVGGLALVGCSKGGGAGTPPAGDKPMAAADKPMAAPAATGNPEFDQKWAALASKDVDAFYVEDDRGQGLMGNVRRAREEQPPPAADKQLAVTANLSQQQISQVIRQNLPGVKACYLRVSREGEQRSGKAIVSFDVGPGGEVRDTKVDAPSFQGTSLPNCVSGMVSHWAFPKSQSGGLAISYPFVFVGG
jgi:hypothetical protein